MSADLTPVEREPLAIRAAVTAAVTAVVHVAVVLGVPLDTEGERAIGLAVDAVGLLVLVMWARPSVVPAAKVVTRVTTSGDVVAGQAADVPTGEVVEPGEAVPVKSGLVDDERHEWRDGAAPAVPVEGYVHENTLADAMRADDLEERGLRHV